jgi:hypothetical protein
MAFNGITLAVALPLSVEPDYAHRGSVGVGLELDLVENARELLRREAEDHDLPLKTVGLVLEVFQHRQRFHNGWAVAARSVKPNLANAAAAAL